MFHFHVFYLWTKTYAKFNLVQIQAIHLNLFSIMKSLKEIFNNIHFIFSISIRNRKLYIDFLFGAYPNPVVKQLTYSACDITHMYHNWYIFLISGSIHFKRREMYTDSWSNNFIHTRILNWLCYNSCDTNIPLTNIYWAPCYTASFNTSTISTFLIPLSFNNLIWQRWFLWFRYFITNTGFKADTFEPLRYWMPISQSLSDWLRASSSEHQFGNPSKCRTLYISIWISIARFPLVALV